MKNLEITKVLVSPGHRPETNADPVFVNQRQPAHYKRGVTSLRSKFRFEPFRQSSSIHNVFRTSLALLTLSSLLMVFPDSTAASVGVSPAKLTQDGYIWENDDGISANSASAQAAGNTAITSVHKGERLTARVQLKNTGDTLTTDRQLALFYDRGDGYWSKVRNQATPSTSAGSCTDTIFYCTNIDSSSDVGQYTSMAIDVNGVPMMSYYDVTNGNLRLGRYVGSGGSGCASSAWMCTTVDSTNNVGQYSSLGVNKAGTTWISEYDASGGNLRVAQYVGSGGTGSCATTAWTCANIDTTNDVGSRSTMAFDSAGNPWILYRDSTANSLKFAHYVGSGGTGCAVTSWTCGTLENTDQGWYTSIAFDPAGNAWASYFDNANSDLRVARYVGTGGSGCTSTEWSCTTVESTNNVGQYSSIAIDSAGDAWVGYYYNNSSDFRVAKYMGSGGSGCTSSAWTCTNVDTTGDVGKWSSIAFDPSGNAWATYYDTTNLDLRLAHYVGSGGSGCASPAWSCTSIETTGNVGMYTSLAFGPNGGSWISSYDTTNGDLHVANVDRGGEITMAAGLSGNNGDGISASHSDMSSAADNSNKNDADCATATTWNNGRWFTTENGTGVSIPAGPGTSQCTEVAFTIDTSQALPNTQYRFVVASDDTWREDKGRWRGPISVVNYPTLTIEANTTARFSKDAQPTWSNCNDTAWGCMRVDGSANSQGSASSMAFDSSGSSWISYRDISNSTLKVAHYTGTGGNCDGNAAWQCTTVDSTHTIGGSSDTKIASDSQGRPWVVYSDTATNEIWAAHYVGSGGSGCSDPAWTCSKIDAVGTEFFLGLGIDANNHAWVSYYNQATSSLRIANYMGTSGTGCTAGVTEWSCTTLDSTNDPGRHNSLAIDNNGMPWVSYRMTNGGGALKVARYVGDGGTGCSISAWTCTTIEAGAYGHNSSIAFGPSNTAWISYRDNSALDLKVAQYVGGGSGSGCATSSDWNCVTIESTGSLGYNTSIAVDAQGSPWITHMDQTTSSPYPLHVARYVGGSSGAGCASSAWSCTTLQTDAGSTPTGFAFDRSGTPWVSYFNTSSSDLNVAKMHQSPAHPSYESGLGMPGRSAGRGDGRYILDFGKSPRTESGTCSSTSGKTGYCGTSAIDGNLDTITAQANESPVAYFSERFASNASANPITWRGQSSVAPSSKSITVQAYRFGSTNAWETLTPSYDGCAASSANSTCTIQGTPAGTASEYFETDGSNYWQYFRVIQTAGASATNLRTEEILFSTPANSAPQAPTGLAQFKSDGTTGIPATTMYTYDSSTGGSVDANGGSVAIDTSTKRTGVGSMKITSATSSMFVNDGHITTRDVSTNGSTLSAWVYVPSASSGAGWFAYLVAYDGTYASHAAAPVAIPRDTWTLITYSPPPSVLADLTFVTVALGGGTGSGDIAYVDDLQQGNSIWTDQTTVTLKASAADQDPTDTVQLCVEIKPIATAFDATGEMCGAGVAYSGSNVPVSSAPTGLTNGTSYHWRARTKDGAGLTSSWASYGGNSESTADIGIDTTAPTAGTVYDGTSAGVDADFNNGSLSSLSANWSAFADTQSGVIRYEYAIGTTPGGLQIRGWTDNSTTASVTATGLTLQTNTPYYFSVRAVDGTNHTSNVATSDGQSAAPTLTFSLDKSTVTFNPLRFTNNYTDSQTVELITSTNAYGGYIVMAQLSEPLASPDSTLPAFSGGTYASPDSWQPGDVGLGYTIDDPLVGGVNKFQAATCPGGSALSAPGCFAPFTTANPGEMVADHVTTVTGSPINNESFNMTLRITAAATQLAGAYSGELSLTALANF